MLLQRRNRKLQSVRVKYIAYPPWKRQIFDRMISTKLSSQSQKYAPCVLFNTWRTCWTNTHAIDEAEGWRNCHKSEKNGAVGCFMKSAITIISSWKTLCDWSIMTLAREVHQSGAVLSRRYAGANRSRVARHSLSTNEYWSGQRPGFYMSWELILADLICGFVLRPCWF